MFHVYWVFLLFSSTDCIALLHGLFWIWGIIIRTKTKAPTSSTNPLRRGWKRSSAFALRWTKMKLLWPLERWEDDGRHKWSCVGGTTYCAVFLYVTWTLRAELIQTACWVSALQMIISAGHVWGGVSRAIAVVCKQSVLLQTHNAYTVTEVTTG